MSDYPQSMDEVAALMRDNVPPGLSPSEFGRKLKWGRGNDGARERMKTLTRRELEEIGLNVQMALNWAKAYEAVAQIMPDNPSAAGRTELMRHAAGLLQGDDR